MQYINHMSSAYPLGAPIEDAPVVTVHIREYCREWLTMSDLITADKFPPGYAFADKELAFSFVIADGVMYPLRRVAVKPLIGLEWLLDRIGLMIRVALYRLGM